MMSQKSNWKDSLPNRQLARAFNFSIDDLAANRAGYMTWAQEQNIPLWQRESFAWFIPILQRLRPYRQTAIKTICGKIKLKFEIKQHHSGRQVRTRDIFQLTIPETDVILSLTRKQAKLLSDRTHYYIYVHPETAHILSLEQAIDGCHENDTSA